MISLPNGCHCSELTVNPKNWKTCKATALEKNWYVQYYFYDTTVNQKKFIVIKGMNRLKTLEERREATRQLIENELYQLKVKGYNPISGTFSIVPKSGINPSTRFIDALWQAYDYLKLEGTTKVDLRTLIRQCETAAKKLGLMKYEIHAIKRRHIMQILEMLPTLKKSWSAYSYNNSRAYLMMLFKKLLLFEAVESNPVSEIPKEEVPDKLKQVLTREQRKQVNDYLLKVDPDFQRVVQIFFHSGSRRTELCRIKVSDVNLDRQEFKVIIKKGRQVREILRPIKDVALPYWRKQLENAVPDDFAISSTFKPGKFKLQPKKISNKWKEYVKEDLGIDVDFYSLKHLNLDETSTILDAEAAAKMAGHTSPVITLKHYLINEKERELEKLKKVNNKFA